MPYALLSYVGTPEGLREYTKRLAVIERLAAEEVQLGSEAACLED